MLTVFCFVVGNGSLFSIKIDQNETVDYLKDKIKEKNEYSFPAKDLQLYLAMKNNQWLSDEDPDLCDLAKDENEVWDSYLNERNKMGPIKKLSRYFSGGKYPMYNSDAKVVHILVVLPNLSQDILKKRRLFYHPSKERRERWNELNYHLIQNEVESNQGNKKKKIVGLPNYASITWNLFSRVFDPITIPYIQKMKPIPADYLKELQDYVRGMFKCFESDSCSEATLNIFIAPVLIQVCRLFDDDMNIIAKDILYGRQVKAKGHFEFVLRRRNVAIYIVETKKDDFKQGAAQNLVGCEVAADIESLNVVHGIVTNFKEWIFYKSCNKQIEKDDSLMIKPGVTFSIDHTLEQATGKIYAILSDSNKSDDVKLQ